VTKKVRVGVLFGGRSGEHEVSLASATSLLNAIDKEKYEPVPIGITREGAWLIGASPAALLQNDVTRALDGAVEAMPDVTHHAILRFMNGGGSGPHDSAVDVVFPVLHGPFGEDGTVQGLLSLLDIPYVGSEVLGSAVSMDKVSMKIMLQSAGLESVQYKLVQTREWSDRRDEVIPNLERDLAYPMFVKPCNMGSSVGITKARDRDELAHGLDVAAQRDRRIIVEEGIEAREVECGVLGNHNPMVSVLGEIRSHHEYYDYDSKYTEGLADLDIPANLSGEQTRTAQDLARRAFLAVDAAGLARVDLFVTTDGRVLVNEINTMPGFTATSMYPKLWEATGVPYPELIDRLIGLAFERFEENRGKSVTR
jgi:D-alanine-D-alanine ligase